jgi:hypothetical protein
LDHKLTCIKINITMEDMYFYPSEAGLALTGAAYFKAWVGVHFGDPPTGGGGGTGLVKNVTMKNFYFQKADEPVYLQSWYAITALMSTSYTDTPFQPDILRSAQHQRLLQYLNAAIRGRDLRELCRDVLGEEQR